MLKIKVEFDKTRSCGDYFRHVSMPANISMIVHDYDSKNPPDIDSEGKSCKITIWKKTSKESEQEVEIFIKNKKIIRTKIPSNIEFQSVEV